MRKTEETGITEPTARKTLVEPAVVSFERDELTLSLAFTVDYISMKS